MILLPSPHRETGIVRQADEGRVVSLGAAGAVTLKLVGAESAGTLAAYEGVCALPSLSYAVANGAHGRGETPSAVTPLELKLIDPAWP